METSKKYQTFLSKEIKEIMKSSQNLMTCHDLKFLQAMSMHLQICQSRLARISPTQAGHEIDHLVLTIKSLQSRCLDQKILINRERKTSSVVPQDSSS